MHEVEVPAEEPWRRVLRRNCAATDPGASETYSFPVTREMFDFMESRWEPVGADERHTADLNNINEEIGGPND